MDQENYSLKIEAAEVIKEVQYAVNSVKLSTVLQCTDETVYLNLETKENCHFCVELTPKGFRVVGRTFDQIDTNMENTRYYETVYAMLDSLSVGYRNTFGDTLVKKLEGLQASQAQQESEGT